MQKERHLDTKKNNEHLKNENICLVNTKATIIKHEAEEIRLFSDRRGKYSKDHS